MSEDGSTGVALDQNSQDVVDGLVRDGRYSSAEEVVREGVKLVEAREAKLAALRQAIAEGGEHTDEEAGAAIEQALSDFEARRVDA